MKKYTETHRHSEYFFIIIGILYFKTGKSFKTSNEGTIHD